jgi:hypothetical protein
MEPSAPAFWTLAVLARLIGRAPAGDSGSQRRHVHQGTLKRQRVLIPALHLLFGSAMTRIEAPALIGGQPADGEAGIKTHVAVEAVMDPSIYP